MNVRPKFILWALAVLLPLLACNQPGGSLPDTGGGESPGPSPQETIQGFNVPVETEESASGQDGQVTESTEESRAQVAGTPTLAAPHVIAVQEMNVRDGPGTYYRVLGRLQQGQAAVVTGQAAPYGALYWKIEYPQGVAGETCWVSSGDEFTRAINVGNVPQVDAPPPPLQRNDVPPEGVAAQLGYFIPFILCQPFINTAGSVQEIRVEALEGRFVCLDGFSPEGVIEVAVLRSDGSIVKTDRIEPLPGGSTGYILQVPPGEPLGFYNLAARQGDLEAAGRFELIPSSIERLYVQPEQANVGDTLQIGVSGAASGSRLYLYRLDPSAGTLPYVYTTELGVVTTDANGNGGFSLRTAPDDPAGEYLVATASGEATARFRLR